MPMKQNDNEIMPSPMTMNHHNEIMTSPMTTNQNDNEPKWQWNYDISNDKGIMPKKQNDNDNGNGNET